MAKVLIIDDDVQIVKLMTAYLQREEHEVVSANDGKQGLKQLQLQQFDLVITDIVMPEMDGLEVLNWLRHQPNCPKVIAISGGSVRLNQDLMLKMARFSADKVMPKPVDCETLTATVRELLQGEGTFNDNALF
jgi:DNA-binding response OmpR family regulator